LNINLDVNDEELRDFEITDKMLEEFKGLSDKIISQELRDLDLDPHVSIEISLTILGPERMQELNKRHRGIDEPTDVLSFPLWEEEDGTFCMPEEIAGEVSLGDIIICPCVVAENARVLEKNPEEELKLIYVHGLLHLLGYDHTTPEEEAIMWRKQEEYLITKGEGDI
jgi:probable rRNA maturation factor